MAEERVPGEGVFPGEDVYPGLILAGGVGHSWFELELTSEHVPVGEVEPPAETPEIQGPQLGGLITSGGGIPISAGEEEEIRVPGRTRPVPDLVPASFTAPGRISAGQIVELNLTGRLRTQREVALSLKGVRREAHHWAAALEDDETVLLAL